MYITDLVLFFLDTYLWYIIWNTVFSVARSFYLGISIWTPWRNVFSRLPKRIYSKVLATGDMEIKYKPKVLISQIWNAIVISMYREHLLSIDHVQKLLYHQVLFLNDFTKFRFHPNKRERERYVPLHSLSHRKTTPSKLSFSHLTAKRSVESLSSRSLFLLLSQNPHPSIICPHLRYWYLTIAKRFCCHSVKSFVKKINSLALLFSSISSNCTQSSGIVSSKTLRFSLRRRQHSMAPHSIRMKKTMSRVKLTIFHSTASVSNRRLLNTHSVLVSGHLFDHKLSIERFQVS